MANSLFLLTFKKIVGLLFIWCFISLAYGQTRSDSMPISLQRIEIKSRPIQTTLILTLRKETIPSFFLLSAPNRLVIDLPNTKASSTLPKNINSSGVISKIRLGNGPQGAGNLRLVLDLSTAVDYVYLDDQNKEQATQTITIILTQKNNLVAPAAESVNQKLAYEEALDLEDLERQSKPAKTQNITHHIVPLTTGQADLIQPMAKNDYTPINKSSLKKIIIMIDPGHGGKDSGALGPNRSMEKMIVLAISKKLEKILDDSPGIDARLTRKGDYFLSLRQRLTIARHNRAQLFIAIHADAYNDTAKGASVFALSAHGATSEAARWLAQRENTSELSGIDLNVKDRQLKSILLDMSQTATIQESLQLGNSLLTALRPITPLHASDVEQAGFVVLKSPDIPSVLVETGFVTNPQEEALLISPSYQDRMAQALAAGVTDYFANNPPPGSWFEMHYTHRSSNAG